MVSGRQRLRVEWRPHGPPASVEKSQARRPHTSGHEGEHPSMAERVRRHENLETAVRAYHFERERGAEAVPVQKRELDRRIDPQSSAHFLKEFPQGCSAEADLDCEVPVRSGIPN